MKNTILVGMVTLFTLPAIAQNNTVVTGSDASGTNGTVSYSIGQVDYINATGSDGNINQGVQQPYEFFNDLGINENSLIVSIFPNPTTDIITINFSSINQHSYKLVDMNGKLLLANEITNQKTEIPMSEFSSGIYHLYILKDNKTIETTKIIKY